MYKNLIFRLMLMFSVSILGCEYNDKEVNNNQNLLNEKSQIVNGDEEKAPEFTLNTTEGNQISLSDYRGKVVILDFWATWCPPCRKGIPDLIELQKEYKGDIVIIGI